MVKYEKNKMVVMNAFGDIKKMPKAPTIGLCLGSLGDQAHEENLYEYRVI